MNDNHIEHSKHLHESMIECKHYRNKVDGKCCSLLWKELHLKLWDFTYDWINYMFPWDGISIFLHAWATLRTKETSIHSSRKVTRVTN